MHWNESDAAWGRRFETTAVNAVQGAYFQLAIWSTSSSRLLYDGLAWTLLQPMGTLDSTSRNSNVIVSECGPRSGCMLLGMPEQGHGSDTPLCG